MNKVKLIKSFAGYLVWEYELLDTWYYRFTNRWVTADDIHKDIVEWMKDHFEEVKERPTSWEAIWKVKCHYIDNGCYIRKKEVFETTDSNRQVRLTREDAEASIALAQITHLLDKYDIPEESKVWIYNNWSLYSVNTPANKRWWLLRFDTPEKREHFYKHHKALIDKLAPFYIF